MSGLKYDHQRIEEKWQKIWEDQKIFSVESDPSLPKYYVLDMFPYPSGAGLHVGHVTGYTATDILARYKRHKGFNVLHPMGWDSFGLPAEQYAMRTGTHPALTTEANIATYRRQLQAMGFSYDWDRELATSDPKYYKWTQWIFTKLYEKGLAYEATALVNYCPALGTVLANEEVEDGLSKEGGYPVERRPLRQWMLRITAYAERLLSDLELIDWPESLKRLQIHWVGRSEGVKIYFQELCTQEQIAVFTTCPETIFGATYMVLSPEHPLVSQLTGEGQKVKVMAYQRTTASKSDLERVELGKEKTGVFLGAYVVNPATQRPIPLWIADYVLMGYGTGAVMGVPAHDERDFAFACRHHLPIVPVIDPAVGTHPEYVPEGSTAAAVRCAVLEGTLCWSHTGTMIDSTSPDGDLILSGLSNQLARVAATEWLVRKGWGEAVVNYRLRDWLFSRQRYWGEPFPILHFPDGSKRTLDIDELPLTPPELLHYKPTEDGASPLAAAQEWVHIVDPKTGMPAMRETNTMPQWAGSCWYYLRFCDPHNDQEAWSLEKEQYWLPVDLYVGGVEHAVLHLLYARFWHKVLYDCGLVHTVEPFQCLRNQGLVCAHSYRFPKGGYVAPAEVRKDEEGKYYQIGSHIELVCHSDKMSKSKLNGVTPDTIVEEYGADSLRLYEMFMGPFEKDKLWNTDAVSGCRRFLTRYYGLVTSDRITDAMPVDAMRLIHRLVRAVAEDIENFQFNTAIAKMMEFMNDFVPLPAYPRKALQMLTLALSPFAPHIAEESWELLGGTTSLAKEPFPEPDLSFLEDPMTLYVIQVNGKLRGKWELPRDKGQEELVAFVRHKPEIARHIRGEIARVIYVPNKLLNFVTDE